LSIGGTSLLAISSAIAATLVPAIVLAVSATSTVSIASISAIASISVVCAKVRYIRVYYRRTSRRFRYRDIGLNLVAKAAELDFHIG